MELKEIIESTLFCCGDGKKLQTNECSQMAEEIIQSFEDAKIKTCTPTERAFLDEIREKFAVCDDGSLGLKSEDYSSMLDQSDFTKCNLQELVEKKG